MTILEKISQVHILGVNIVGLDVATLHTLIGQVVNQNGKELILHANIYGLNLAYQHKWLRNFLNKALIVFCDGAGVQLGAQLLGAHIPHRITYADWMWELGKFCEEERITLFFLGGRSQVADKAAIELQKRFPNLQIVGKHHGYFDKSPDSTENAQIVHLINKCAPDILIVGFGMPLQEYWLMENWDRLNVKVGLTGGAVFDYISGELRRGPKWMTDHGFEWLARLIIEPQRLWRRYVVGNPLFLFRILKQRWGFDKISFHSYSEQAKQYFAKLMLE